MINKTIKLLDKLFDEGRISYEELKTICNTVDMAKTIRQILVLATDFKLLSANELGPDTVYIIEFRGNDKPYYINAGDDLLNFLTEGEHN